MNNLFTNIENSSYYKDFKYIKISLSSPDKIKSWSYGEIKKPETINYRTFKPEKDGLFCSRIFGPIKDYECLCGKYKKNKYIGIICDKCGVEVISSKVRRSRMGHINLVTPVSHIWFLKSLPSRLSIILDISLKDLEKIIYFESYIIVDNGNTDLKINQILNENEYLNYLNKYKNNFVAKIGGEAILYLLNKIDLNKEYKFLSNKLKLTLSDNKKKKIYKKLKLVESFILSNNKPEWMMLTVLPVLPPDLRPLVPLDSGRFATSDLNDLYRRIINRNNRLKKLINLSAPDIIIKNEKRMLQESVDALLDNSRKTKSILNSNKRQLKSLSDMIKGKQGRFRQNLLGKRVDYSGRSVIIVGPNLKLNQCGIPKKMALELFKPFIYGRLQRLYNINNIKIAKKIVDDEEDIVWEILDNIIENYPILLNRAPTLHRLGIQAFELILVEGKAIQLHPLVCNAYNADFDGDQMAIHIPLTIEAQLESKMLMMSTNNILSPANGEPIIMPSQDIILGIYYLTKNINDINNNNISLKNIFCSTKEVENYYNMNLINLYDIVYTKIIEYIKFGKNFKENIFNIKTTVGRCILWNIMPKGIKFKYINDNLNKIKILNIIKYCYHNINLKETIYLLDKIMNIGFHYASISGLSISINDLIIPKDKQNIISNSDCDISNINKEYNNGLITLEERYNKIIDVWSRSSDKISNIMMKELSLDKTININNIKDFKYFNSVYMMADSGARGSETQIKQLSGMRGLMAKPDGAILETPIKSNFREGLSILEYFISTHGARKGLADTALKTANSGYLTRRLVDVTQDIIISKYNCKTTNGIKIFINYENSTKIKESFKNKIFGRVLSNDIEYGNKNIIKKDTLIDKYVYNIIISLYLNSIEIRSPITCESEFGICCLCYGLDLSKGTLVKIGEAVGIIAAQSIGEPGTQLTMRTFHIGGAVSNIYEKSNIKFNNDGILNLYNVKFVKNNNNVNIITSRNSELMLLDVITKKVLEKYNVPYGSILNKNNNELVKKGDIIVYWDPYTIPIVSEFNGIIKFIDLIENKTYIKKKDYNTNISYLIILDNIEKIFKPMIQIINKDYVNNSHVVSKYFLYPKTIILVKDNQNIFIGDILAKIPKSIGKTKDITGGLPRVSDLFEARKPKNPALLAEIDGIISFGEETKNKKKIIITNNNFKYEESISRWKQIIVFDGEFINKGDLISEGNISPHDILRLKGIHHLSNFLINEVQNVYKLQNVNINSKHIEIIIKQMLKKVIIKDPGDSNLISGDKVKLNDVKKINIYLKNNKKKEIIYDHILMGVTKSSLLTDSFISSASFQETTKVLTESSILGKIDYLKGLKENIIVGRLIPSGTGYFVYNK